MREYETLSHVKWECKYHIVWVPKYRWKRLYGQVRRRFGQILRELCRQKGIELLEGHAISDHVHICASVPPKYSISSVAGFLKGKSAIGLNKEFSSKIRGSKIFWARGYFVSTVGLDEHVVQQYINQQEEHDKRQMEIEFGSN